MNRIALLLTTLGIAAGGCTEYALNQDKGVLKDLNEDGAPDIAVDPMQLDFGDVYVNAK